MPSDDDVVRDLRTVFYRGNDSRCVIQIICKKKIQIRFSLNNFTTEKKKDRREDIL